MKGSVNATVDSVVVIVTDNVNAFTNVLVIYNVNATVDVKFNIYLIYEVSSY